jgi:hypothetical protein
MSGTDVPPKTGAGDLKVGGDGDTISAQAGGKRSAWLTHVKKTMRANKGMKLKQVLKIAKKTYKKTMRGGSKGGIATTAAQAGGRRHRKGSRKNGTRKH